LLQFLVAFRLRKRKINAGDDMPEKFVIYGSEYSPFSVKVRSYFRYKQLAHEWRPRTQENYADFQARAKLPLIPLIITPDDIALQDSTPILEKMELQFPEKSILPSDRMIEEYGDEWGNKPMFHYRWWHKKDQIAVSEGLANGIMPSGSEREKSGFAKALRDRMVPRLSFVGSSEKTKETIESSLDDTLALLEDHLKARDFLFGGRPSIGDFGLFAQLQGCLMQPTTEPMINASPSVASWIARMLDPKASGDWEEWDNLKATMLPFLKNQIADLYFPWAMANAKALRAEKSQFDVMLKGREFSQDTMKYTARSLHQLKLKFSEQQDRGPLEEVLLQADCLQPLLREDW
jgi:glutathione S-transferase